MSTYGYVNTFGVYQDHYTRSNFASASAISWIGSTQLFLVLAGALPAGKLLDMGYFRHTTLVGSIIYVFSCVSRQQEDVSDLHLQSFHAFDMRLHQVLSVIPFTR